MKPIVFQPMDMSTAESLLKEAKTILDQLGVDFFLRHGTCLGAVRDQAFIPWDDDLDIGSVIGLHGLTEEKVYETAEVFKENGYNMEVIDSELHLSVDLKKFGIQMDWTCYRIINDSIYQWPVLKIPVSLHVNLKPIEFLGETFMVPNPPEDYFRLKYGPNWMIPKQAGGFEEEVLDLMEQVSSSGNSESKGVLLLSEKRDPKNHNTSLRVVDDKGHPIPAASVSLAATTVLTGLDKSDTDENGFVYFHLPEEACYVVAVQSNDHTEVLYLEELVPGINYVYRPDPEHPTGRMNALVPDIT